MVPIKTSIEDIQKLMAFLSRQIGWVDSARIEKALGALDDRKVAAMVEFGYIVRDGGNIRTTERGQLFNTDQKAALREVLLSVDLYRATLEWVHYGKRTEVTAAEVGQYWESSHKDTIGGLSGSTLGAGAVTFGRVADGAGVGSFVVGRGGKETRVSFEPAAVDTLLNGKVSEPDPVTEATPEPDDVETPSDAAPSKAASAVSPLTQSSPPVPTVSVATSPSVHVNVEIHIAADATADTVREIFKNMARYVLDKSIDDDGR